MVRSGLALLLLLATLSAALAEKRVALVVGNAAYEEAGALANPVNDARDVADALLALGFIVIEGTDLGKRELERRVGEFADALAGADVGMFFYAGHGIQVDGRNFLLPTDARLDVPAKLRLEAVSIDDVIDIMESQVPVSLVFLDACRNNPFPKASGNRGATALGSGLAQFDATRGSFIAFSTAPGAVALDGAGRNSPFAAALVRHVGTPGQSINDMMIAVRRDVMADTKGTQRPWEQGSLARRFEFAPAAGSAPAAPAGEPQRSAAVDDGQARRGLGSSSEIEALIRRDYLAPQSGDVATMIRRLYAPGARLYGVPYDLETLVRTKTDWFSAYRSWDLGMEPGSLHLTDAGTGRVAATFDMRYDYEPAAAGAPRHRGRARVHLEFASSADGWRIVSESSEALP